MKMDLIPSRLLAVHVKSKQAALACRCRRYVSQHTAQRGHTRANVKELVETDKISEEKTRNIGILAHIDAGKTTTTERMLFASGLTRRYGTVDSGDTIMDFMPQERERGITINSATITFPWKDFRINLIDTPGHVDFTVEVERTLLALDGVVIILDASKGVQAQTQTVWRQAVRFGLPSIIFLNKMDKPGASVPRCVEQLEKKLGINPLVLQVPIGDGKSFHGAADVLGSSDRKLDDEEALKKARMVLLEKLATVDDDFADLYLNDPDALDNATIESEIREACLKRQLSPLLLGSSLKSQGVTSLLDAVTRYFPSPLELEKPLVSERLASSTGFYGLAFKNVYDRQKGLLTFLRLYRGNLKPGTTLYNVNKHQREKVSKVLEAYADELREIPEAREGNIAVISGMKETATGDTLVGVSHAHPAHLGEDAGTDQVPILRIPDPVYFCSIEAESQGKQQALDDALRIIQQEDPSVHVRLDSEVGQLIISGMGELHLEVIRDRIKTEYGLEVYLGPLQVAYKETVTEPVDHAIKMTREIQSAPYSIDIKLRVSPIPDNGPFRKLKVSHEAGKDERKIADKEVIRAVENGVAAGLSTGAVMGSPVIDVRVELLDVQVTRGTLPALVSAAATACIREILPKAQCQVLQPMMNICITLPSEQVHDVLADLNRRQAQIKEIDVVDEATRTVVAECPLASMMHFSRDVRTVSHGLAHISIELGRYDPVDPDQLQKVLARF